MESDDAGRAHSGVRAGALTDRRDADRRSSRLMELAFAAPDEGRDLVQDMPPPPRRAVLAWRDLARGLSWSWMWWALAWQDIKLRYRGSVLGPFWLTLSTLLMVLAMGVIYARLFHADIHVYVPYLAMGLIIWQLISGLITDGCQTFLASEGVIQQVPIPFSIHVYRVVCRNFIVLGHNLVLVPIGIVALDLPVDWHLLEVVPACVVLALNGVWIGIFFGILSARFRDIPPIVASVLQIAFFITPIFYPLSALGNYRLLADINPLFAAVDVLRAPLTGVAVAKYSWPLLLISTAFGCGVTFAVFARFRGRIAYWI